MKKYKHTVLLGLSLLMCFGLDAGQAKKKVKEGNLLYNRGAFAEALRKYEEALGEQPESDVINFNLGAASYKTGDFESAITHFEKALVSDDPALEEKALYNAAGAKYKRGIAKEETDLAAAIQLLEQALEQYQQALTIDANDTDASYNYDFVSKELERLKSKQKE